MTSQQLHAYRNTTQELPPLGLNPTSVDHYGLYPATPVARGTIGRGFLAIAEKLVGSRFIRIDGFVGVFWDDFKQRLEAAFADLGVHVHWVELAGALKSESEINRLAGPYLGGDDPLFGTRFEGRLSEVFDDGRFESLVTDDQTECTTFYGCGAGLVEIDGPLVYVDLPKSEVQFRSRAGAVGNLGVAQPADPKTTYKRYYFFDWPMLNRHKASIVEKVDWFVDEQRPEAPTIISGEDLRQSLDTLSRSMFRVRPWFEPGPWGGQWIMEHIPQLPQDVPNYAWSFELITPENGLMFDDGEQLLEVSFDWAMYLNSSAILGECEARFGVDFPIRFNFLDTFNGGNLSVQCHPRPEYVKRHFGEPFTQDECYYIIDSKSGSEVYLGFVEGIDPEEFGDALKQSFAEGTEMDVRRYVNSEPTNNHDFFLIPGGTIHSSGVDNLVLEISATTYIFTFKMYDWQRMGLDGKPRPLNIDRALENLYFERQGERVAKELVSRPAEIEHGDDWRMVHLPTHPDHFYDVHRFEFDTEVTGYTENSPNVMALVEGSSVIVETKDGSRQEFNYAETFVVPAAAESYKLINTGESRAMVVKAFVKPLSNKP